MDNSIRTAITFAKEGNNTSLAEWIDMGNSPNQYDVDGWTPLLWASARGHASTVELLLDKGADIDMGHKLSEALAIHLAGHSGSIETTDVILKRKPEHIDAVWDLNGHTILLQASFYGHVKLADYLVKKGANTAITTARGLGPLEMGAQFQNQAMVDTIKPFDSSKKAKQEYYKKYLAKISPVIPLEEKEIQELSDQLVETIEVGVKKAFTDPESVEITLKEIKSIVEDKGADVNRLGGVLGQPALVVTVTGNNGLPAIPAVAKLRYETAKILLKNGADPAKHENHPMGAQTIIRAAVFNHLDIMKMCADYMTPKALTDAINEIPVVNGLTALHDTVLRASTASPDKFEGYLEQTKWFMDHGGKSDIEDFAGTTQKNIAERVKNEAVRKRLLEIL